MPFDIPSCWTEFSLQRHVACQPLILDQAAEVDPEDGVASSARCHEQPPD